MAKTKWTILDTLFVIFTSLAIVLLLFWIVGQLKGQDVFNELPEWTMGIASEIWGFLISSGLSVLTFWLKSSKENSPNYLLWIFVSVAAFIVLTGGVSILFTQTVNDPVKKGMIRFSLDYPDAPEILVFTQTKPWSEGIKNIHVQPNGYFEAYNIDLPNIGDKYVAIFKPLVETSEYSNDPTSKRLVVCFNRLKKKLPEDNCIGFFKFNNQYNIEIDVSDPGCIELCENVKTGNLQSFKLFPSAYAQSIPNYSSNPGWVIPTLETLYSKKELGFSHVIIESKSLQEGLINANYYTYAIFVNETPVFINGFLPEDLMRSFDYNKGILLEFGLENLNFSGKHNGNEELIIKLSFFSNSEYIAGADVAMDYVAIRNTTQKLLPEENGSQFQWEAKYQTTTVKEYEVFNYSSTALQGALNNKKKIDDSNLYYQNRKLVGVVRPPLGDNKHYGVILGLELPNKQIIFTFDKEEANEFLSWAKLETSNVFRSDIYLYRIKGY